MRQRTEDTLVGYSGVLVAYEVDVRLSLWTQIGTQPPGLGVCLHGMSLLPSTARLGVGYPYRPFIRYGHWTEWTRMDLVVSHSLLRSVCWRRGWLLGAVVFWRVSYSCVSSVHSVSQSLWGCSSHGYVKFPPHMSGLSYASSTHQPSRSVSPGMDKRCLCLGNRFVFYIQLNRHPQPLSNYLASRHACLPDRFPRPSALLWRRKEDDRYWKMMDIVQYILKHPLKARE